MQKTLELLRQIREAVEKSPEWPAVQEKLDQLEAQLREERCRPINEALKMLDAYEATAKCSDPEYSLFVNMLTDVAWVRDQYQLGRRD